MCNRRAPEVDCNGKSVIQYLMAYSISIISYNNYDPRRREDTVPVYSVQCALHQVLIESEFYH